MAELDNNGMFLQWDERFEKMIHNQLAEEYQGLCGTSTDMTCMSSVIQYPFGSSISANRIITCLYCKSQHNILYLNKHSHAQCSQCGAPLNLN